MKQRSHDAAYLVTANDLFSGRTIYHTGDGWSALITDAVQHDDLASAEAQAGNLNKMHADQIVGAYTMAVDCNGQPTASREARRLAGPGAYTEPPAGLSTGPEAGHPSGADMPARDEHPPENIGERDSNVSLSGI